MAVPSAASRGPGRPPAAQSAETRGRILRAAREVFSESGYAAATFQSIAVRADLTRPAINHHFPSKAALYQAVVEQANATVVSGIDQALREMTFARRIEVYLRGTAEAQRREHAEELDQSVPAFLVVLEMESQRNPELRGQDNDAIRHTREFIATALRDGIATGELRADIDVDTVTEMLFAMLWGLGFYAGFVGDARQMGPVLDEFVRMVTGVGLFN